MSAISVTHAKTNNITNWTQSDLDAQIALGNFPAGTHLADIVLPSDWNANHTVTLPTTSALTDGATINWDLSAAPVARVTLGGNRTVAAPTNMTDGYTYILEIIQDGTGSRTLTWNAAFLWPSGIAPTLSTGAGKVDIITFVSNGTQMKGVFSGDFR